jgi:methyl-accepting chemotaxis protein
MLNNTKIGPKLIGGFTAVALVSVTVGLMGRHFLIVNDDADTFLYEKMTVPIQELGKANAAFLKNRVLMRDMIRANAPEKIAEKDAGITRNAQIVSEEMATYEKNLFTDAGRAAFSDFTKDRVDFLAHLTEMRKLAMENRDEEAYVILDGDGAKSAQAEQDAIDKMMELKMEAAKKTADDNTTRTNRAINTMWAVIVFGFLGALTLGVLLTNSIVDPLKRGLAMMTELAMGHLQTRLMLERQDEIGKLAGAMDRFADDLKNNVVGSMAKISGGDLSVQVTPKDDRDEISPAINKTTASLRGLVAESKTLIAASLEGRLSTRGNANTFQGGYREIVQGVNDILDAVIKPVQEASGVLERLAHKDMTARVHGNYQGDHAKIKEAVNQAAEILDQSLQQVAVGADQIASASGQIGTGAQALAQGTSEQASSLEEVSSSLQEMTAMTRQNSANAKEARGIAEATKTSAENGVGSMQRLSAAMEQALEQGADRYVVKPFTAADIERGMDLAALKMAAKP